MQTVATRQTVKQMLAAKKTAKKLTQEERALERAGKVKNIYRNKLSGIPKGAVQINEYQKGQQK